MPTLPCCTLGIGNSAIESCNKRLQSCSNGSRDRSLWSAFAMACCHERVQPWRKPLSDGESLVCLRVGAGEPSVATNSGQSGCKRLRDRSPSSALPALWLAMTCAPRSLSPGIWRLAQAPSPSPVCHVTVSVKLGQKNVNLQIGTRMLRVLGYAAMSVLQNRV